LYLLFGLFCFELPALLTLKMPVANLQILSPGESYGIVIGLGIGFTLIMIMLSLTRNRYGSHNTFKSTEEFIAASRSINPGMIAAGIVSSWTHASTLLTSCTLAYTYGVGGRLWYGAVGTFQTLLFAVAAFKVKEKSNNAHTFPGEHLRDPHSHLEKADYPVHRPYYKDTESSPTKSTRSSVWSPTSSMAVLWQQVDVQSSLSSQE
jgi:hypothetical protein